jgi:uncharacterized protein (UPF0332 family)
LLDEGRLRPHHTDAREIADLLAVVGRDIADASIEAVSLDRRFATAYSASLQLATVVLYASGYRASAQRGHHAVTIRVLPDLIGDDTKSLAAYLDSCRSLRNTSDYDRAGAVSERDVLDLLAEVECLRGRVCEWLQSCHPELSSP